MLKSNKLLSTFSIRNFDTLKGRINNMRIEDSFFKKLNTFRS